MLEELNLSLPPPQCNCKLCCVCLMAALQTVVGVEMRCVCCTH